MASSGYLVPPSQDPSKQALWVETWKRVDRFLPELRDDLALEKPNALPDTRETLSQPDSGRETGDTGAIGVEEGDVAKADG